MKSHMPQYRRTFLLAATKSTDYVHHIFKNLQRVCSQCSPSADGLKNAQLCWNRNKEQADINGKLIPTFVSSSKRDEDRLKEWLRITEHILTALA